MARPDLNLGDVGVDPDAREAYRQTLTGNLQMPKPPVQDHPIVQFAQQQLAPLNFYSQSVALPQATQPPADLGLTNVFNNLKAGGQTIQDALGALSNAPVFGGLLQGLGTVGGIATAPFNAPGALLTEPGRQAATNNYRTLEGGEPGIFDVPAVARALQAGSGAAAGMFGQVAEDTSVDPEKRALAGIAQFATGAAPNLAPAPFIPGGAGKLGESARPNLVAAAGKDAARYVVETGKTRSLIRDTVTGKTEPTIFADAAKAEAAAAKLNATTGNAPEAGIAVPNEAGLRAALNDVTKVKTPDGDIGRTVRIAARELGLTEEQMLASPEMRGQLMAALGRAKVPASDENISALASQLLAQEKARPTVGNKSAAAAQKAVADAVGDPFAIPAPVNVPASAEQAASSAGVKTAAQQSQADILRAAIAKKEAALAKAEAGPKLVATTPNEVPLPRPPAGRASAGAIASDVVLEVNALFRGALAGGDLSTVLLQGAPLLAKDVSKLPFYAVEAARGGAQRPYFNTALARLGQAALSGEKGMRAINEGFYTTLEKNGLRPGKDVFISDPLGSPLAREEFTAGQLIQKLPVLGFIYRQGNFATTTFLNALRVGEAVNLKRAYDQLGLPFPAAKVGHLVNIATGRGDLPFANGEYAQATAKALQGIFFGPRLMSATFQNVTDNIGAVAGVGKAIARRQPLQPVDVARIHATVGFVATGVGVLKLLEASGMSVGTDPQKTDFGRVTLPGGIRVDFWGPFNETARLIARETAFVNQTAQGVKPKYGASNGLDLAVDYLRSKLGPLASAGASVLAGRNQAGQTPAEVVQSTIANPNPLSNPESIVPAPFTAQTAALAFDPARGGPGGLGSAALTAAGTLGVTVLPPRTNIPKDGLGRPEGSPNFGQDEIIREYESLFPGKTLTAPDDTIGSGKNKVKLPSTEADKYIAAVGEARRVDLGNLIYSPEYQALTKDQKEKKYQSVKEAADNRATREYLAHGVIEATDPDLIAAEAVAGFHAQGGSNKNEAYWVALLDKAGKLTPEVARAIDESQVTLPGQKAPITVAEMRNDAPLVHEYLSHVPFGTDQHPLGTPADWVAVQAAKQQQAVLKDQLIRSGVNPSLAETQAKQQTLSSLQSMVQRSLFLNGSSLANQQRKALITKYGQRLSRYLQGDNVPYTQEQPGDYPGQ